jgi:hypothetical protein
MRLGSARSRHPSVEWRLRSEAYHTCSFDITKVLAHTIWPHGQSPLPRCGPSFIRGTRARSELGKEYLNFFPHLVATGKPTPVDPDQPD